MGANLHVIDGIPKPETALNYSFHRPLYAIFALMTDEEKKFITYWESNREQQQNIVFQLLSGLPYGLAFSLPVLLVFIYHNWYKNLPYVSNAQIVVVIIAVILIAVFIAVFRKRFQWDQQEQIYKELKFKQEQESDAADL